MARRTARDRLAARLARRRRAGTAPTLSPRYPVLLAREYWRALRSMEEWLLAKIPTWLSPALEVAQSRVDGAARLDDLQSNVSGALSTLQQSLQERFTEAGIAHLIRPHGQKVDDQHRRAFQTALRSLVGVEVLESENIRGPILDGWVAENVDLITTIRDEAIPGMAADIEQAFAQGLRHEDLLKKWQREGLPVERGTLRQRARVIARDQISKLNGQLTEHRQGKAGIDEYDWMSVADGARVRPLHRQLHGTRRKWSDPHPTEGHPGHAIQCRCTARAVIDLDALLGNDSVTPVTVLGRQALEEHRRRGRQPQPHAITLPGASAP